MSKLWLTALAVLMVAAIGGAWWYNGDRTPPAPTVAAPPSPTPASTAPDTTAAPATVVEPAPTVAATPANPVSDGLSSDDRILGRPDAPITIIEYASLTCPHCAAFERDILPTIKKEWIDTGKAKLVFRDFPLDGSAVKAAMVARCAPENRFYGFIEVMFAQQGSWGTSADPTPGLARLAKLGGMSEEQFQTCLKDDALQNKILASRLAGANEYKVESTPTFMINGKRVVGAQPYETFDQVLKSVSP